jgi:DNA polymerase I-like protein with 3'-5' exonuclease and polymerase domains
MRDKNGFVIQNIPVRTETGKKLVEAFRQETPLLSVDYSTLELRILAQLARDEKSRG